MNGLDPQAQKTSCTTHVITSWGTSEVSAEEWNELLRSSDADSVFLTWEWMDGWLRTVLPDAALMVVIVRNAEGQLIAIAPFYRSEFSLLGFCTFRCLRIIGDCQSGGEYPDLILRKGWEDVGLTHVVEALHREARAWDCIWICNMAGWTGTVQRMEEIFRRHHWLMRKRNELFATVRLPETHDAYLATFSSKSRWRIRKETSKLQEAHTVKLVRTEADALSGYLDVLFDLHARRWQRAGERGSFARRPLMQQFYRAFAPIALDRGWLRLYALEVDGAVEAIQYGYAYRKVFYQLQEGYNPDGIPGIGNVLRNLVIRDCIEEGLTEYDFLGGWSDHKKRWRGESREGHDVFIARPTLKTRLLFAKEVWPTGRYIREGGPAGQTAPRELPDA